MTHGEAVAFRNPAGRRNIRDAERTTTTTSTTVYVAEIQAGERNEAWTRRSW